MRAEQVQHRPPRTRAGAARLRGTGHRVRPVLRARRRARQAGGHGPESAPLLEVARRHDATPAQVRLAWTLHQAPNVLAIPGTGDPAHLEQNVAAAALPLDEDDLTLLNA
ncbi:MAG TPA: aldo/keto reductase [Trebonia sp.]|nr:aldo/keto reductase [Trebonia sp.]